MYKKTVLVGLASALLLFSIFGTLSVTPVMANPNTIRVPEDYATIQAAVDAANLGDKIQVASGTYYENVKVAKSVKLIGEDSETTIIDGNGTDTVVYVTVDNVDISGFTIQNGMGGEMYCPGIYLHHSSRSKVSFNIVLNNFIGILLSSSSGNIVSCNLVTDNQYGIDISSSSGNIIRNNIVASNWLYGINLFASNENTIVGNTISYNTMTTFTYGIYFGPISDANILYHNNFINNSIQAYENQGNTWDNGVEGNYWSDYVGEDLNGDGVGDTLLPHQGVDYYPLIEPWSPVRVFDGIIISSNSTVASFNFSAPLMQVSFNIIGPPGTVGFCNVTIPKSLLGGVFMILIDGTPIDYALSRNSTHFSLYFTYGHGSHSVEILDVFGILVKSWYSGTGYPRYDERTDLNGDGFIDVIDLAILAKNWYKA